MFHITKYRCIFALCLISLSFLQQGTAEACSPSPCTEGLFIPLNGVLPENAPGIQWVPQNSFSKKKEAKPEDITLFRLEGRQKVKVKFILKKLAEQLYLIIPDPNNSFQESQVYEVLAKNLCTSHGSKTPKAKRFQIGPKAILPKTETINLKLKQCTQGKLEVATSSGSCLVEINAIQAQVMVELPDTLKPWKHLLHFQTYIGTETWRASHSLVQNIAPGQSWKGRGIDTLYTTCKSPDKNVGKGLRQGTHSVYMTVSLPGTTYEYKTKVVQIELTCDQPKPSCKAPKPKEVTLEQNVEKILSEQGAESASKSDGGTKLDAKPPITPIGCQSNKQELAPSLFILFLLLLLAFLSKHSQSSNRN